MITIEQLKQGMYRSQNSEKQQQMESYMRNQFPFLGIQAQERRQLSHDFIYQYKTADSIDWSIIERLWQEGPREFKYIALDLLRRQKRQLQYDDIVRLKQMALFESWWDTIDVIDILIGELSLYHHDSIAKLMLSWSKDESIWLRRIAIDHQRLHREKTDVALLTQVIKNNLGQTEFFINKAIGWSLREYSKTDAQFVQQFVNEHDLSSLSEREALKWLKNHR